MTDTQQFYDGLADLYHFIYEDWPASIERQAAVLGFVDLRRIDDKFFQPLIAAKRPAS